MLDETAFRWTTEHEQVLTQIKEDILTTLVGLILICVILFIFIRCRTGLIFVQNYLEGKRVVYFSSRSLDRTEQKPSTMHRKNCGINFALKTYEHCIFGSPHTNYIFLVTISFFMGSKRDYLYFFQLHLIFSQL